MENLENERGVPKYRNSSHMFTLLSHRRPGVCRLDTFRNGARQGDVKTVEMLLACGLDVNAADYDLRTAIHLAASTGNKHVVEVLLKRSADVNVKDRWGGTALADAIREGHAQVAELIRARAGR